MLRSCVLALFLSIVVCLAPKKARLIWVEKSDGSYMHVNSPNLLLKGEFFDDFFEGDLILTLYCIGTAPLEQEVENWVTAYCGAAVGETLVRYIGWKATCCTVLKEREESKCRRPGSGWEEFASRAGQ
jgi:hypothetical protein